VDTAEEEVFEVVALTVEEELEVATLVMRVEEEVVVAAAADVVAAVADAVPGTHW
jgi:hypothetical protein